MSLKIVFGRAGTGKTSWCFDTIKHSIGSILLLVPESMSHETELRAGHEFGFISSIGADVITFERLAYRVFNEFGGAKGRYITPATKNIILSKILKSRKQDLILFSGLIGKPGFINVISDLISEMKKNLVTPEMLVDFGKEAVEPELKKKLNDIGILYGDYESYLENIYLDSNDNITVLSKKINEYKYMENAKIFIDGFSGFTLQEYEVIKELMKIAEVSVTLAFDEINSTSEIFKSTIATSKKLIDIALKCSTQIFEPINLNGRFDPYSKTNEFMHIEECFAAGRYIKYEKETVNIKLSLSQNPFNEVENVAKDIVSLINDRGYKFSDIGVITVDSSQYRRLIDAIFTDYKLNFYQDSRRSIRDNNVIALVLSVLEIQVSNWDYESVFSYLKSGLIGIDEKDIYLAENFVLEYGIKFYNWTSTKKYANTYLETVKNETERIAAFNRVKEGFTPAILNYIAKTNKDKSAGSYCRALYEFLIETKIPTKLEEITEEFLKSNSEEKADEYKQVWNYLANTMDSIFDVFQNENFEPDDFYKTFSAALEEFSIGIIPKHFDEITVGIPGRGKMHGIKALYVLGMNDGKFPASYTDEGMLNDADRRSLRQKGIELSEDTEAKTFLENFNIYNVLSIPTEYLYLSYPTADNSGSALRASFVIVKIKNMFPKLSTGFADEDNNSVDLCETSEIDLPPTILKESADQLYKDKIFCSITRIEKFAKCPLSYFLEYGIKAKERKIQEVSPADIGNITHMVLEYFPSYISERNLSFEKIDKAQTISLVNEIITNIFEKMKDEGKFEYEANSTYIKRQIEGIAARSAWLLVKQMRAGSFDVYGSEIEYGNDASCGLPPIIIQLDFDKELIINGKIDRVDTVEYEGDTYFRVIDYKTGKKEFKIDEFYEGTQVQLIGYMKAFSNLGSIANKKAAGFFYFKAANPFLNKRGITDDELELVSDSELKLNGRALKDIRVLSLMDGKLIENKGSEFLPIKINKDESIREGSPVITQVEMEDLISAFTGVCKKIGKEMVCGYIKAKPSEDACAFCNFSEICRVKQKGVLESVRKTELDE